MKTFVTGVAVALVSLTVHAAQLTVVKAGPVGATASLAEASEIRVVFSEPMVTAGKAPGEAPWFHVAPEVKGAFRWAGTTTLIFTPSPRLPYATRYKVTVDASATSLAGNRLDQPYTFSFVTPTIRLLRTDWYRRNGRFDSPIVIGLWFNQPVDAETIAQHLQLRTAAHEWTAPVMPPSDLDRLRTTDPQTVSAFEERIARAKQSAQSNGAAVLSFLTTDWDKDRWPSKPELVVLETKPGVRPDTTLNVVLDATLAKTPAHAPSGTAQEFPIQLPPAFFVEKASCVEMCNPEQRLAIEFRAAEGVEFEKLRKAIRVTDVTAAGKDVPLTATTKEKEFDPKSSEYSLDDLGYTVLPAHKYRIRIDPALESSDGQQLGYTWLTTVSFGRKSSFVSFGGGHGVWESSGGSVLPFHARNVRNVRQWLAPLTIEELMPAVMKLKESENKATPSQQPAARKLAPVADKIQSYGVDVKPLLGAAGTGFVWAAIEQGESIPMSKPAYEDNPVRATLVQVTNLGISVKDSPLNTVVLVTRLSDGTPVAGAKVSIRKTDNSIFWTGMTDANGLVVAPRTDLRIDRTKKSGKEGEEAPDLEDSWDALDTLHFLVTAEKDGDVAYVGSDWHEGVLPWDFGLEYNLGESAPLLRGQVFTDRGVYKLGEEVHLKAVLRSDTPQGMQLLPAGTAVEVTIHDSHDKEVGKRSLTVNEWSSGEWVFKLPAAGTLGTYQVMATARGQRLQTLGDFLVAAYRRPDFRVDAKLGAVSSLAGAKLDGTVTGRYLFGAAMATRPVKWTYSRKQLLDVPAAIRERWPEERYSFLAMPENEPSSEVVSSKEAKLDANGQLAVSLTTPASTGVPYAYVLEGEVTDLSRQKIAGRATFRVDPAPWYIGVRNPPYFGDAAKGIDTDIVAVTKDGTPTAGVPVKVTLTRIQWNSVRHAEGNGMYTWDSEMKEEPAGEWSLTTSSQPVPLHVPVGSGGSYLLTATSSDASGHATTTRVDFYATGAGYTAWQRYDHNRIDLVPEKKTYRPGETARIMVKSPWAEATALLTTEREGVRSWKQFHLTSTQQTITVPIGEGDIPNVFVSVLLVKGRTKEGVEDESDPGKPAFRLGYVDLNVVDAMKRLNVSVKSNREEFRPAEKAKINVNVVDDHGRGTASEVTLWAVDYGVLSLTGYETPDVLKTIYLHKALQVANEDSRQRIISRRVLTPKGATDGGGGGRDAGPGTLRKDFRVLAFWVGSVRTDANGHATSEVTLPESLSTYRIMAVAGDRQSRFGWGQNEIRINKPVVLSPAWPRFLAVGDSAYFGATVHSQLEQAGKAAVTIRSLDPKILSIDEEGTKTSEIGAAGSSEVRFHARALTAGDARLQMTVTLGGETDAFQDTIPVRVLVAPETYAAYGEAGSQGTGTTEAANTRVEEIAIPADVVPGYGGLHFDLSSTALTGLSDGADYLVTYPYGCAEQRSSAALALMLAADLGQAFKLPGIDAPKARVTAQTTLNELPKFQCDDGGFAFWAGDCSSASPFLTSYLLHVYQRGKKLGYTIDKPTLERGYLYLEQKLGEKRPAEEGWWPAYTAWQAFAVKVLVEGGRNEDSHITRLLGHADRMPLFGIAYLSDALAAKGDKGPRAAELHRRMTNAILPEAGSAHVEELKDPHLLWFWNSNVRSTAIVMGALVRRGSDEPLVKQMARWLMKVRKGGHWGSTQENAWAMESLVDYYRRYEAEVPAFTGAVVLGSEPVASETFSGRSTAAISRDLPMTKLAAGSTVPMSFTRTGTGTLFYALRLRYAKSMLPREPLDQGFTLARRYALESAATGKAAVSKGAATSFNAGDLIRVTLTVRNTKERRFVAVTDPIPAGTEPVEAWFATTATQLAQQQQRQEDDETDWMWWRRGGFDHVERHDDRVLLFATRLGEGSHEFTYLLRATTAGTFVTAPMQAEEMYEPEVFGRTGSTTIEVAP